MVVIEEDKEVIMVRGGTTTSASISAAAMLTTSTRFIRRDRRETRRKELSGENLGLHQESERWERSVTRGALVSSEVGTWRLDDGVLRVELEVEG